MDVKKLDVKFPLRILVIRKEEKFPWKIKWSNTEKIWTISRKIG